MPNKQPFKKGDILVCIDNDGWDENKFPLIKYKRYTVSSASVFDGGGEAFELVTLIEFTGGAFSQDRFVKLSDFRSDKIKEIGI